MKKKYRSIIIIISIVVILTTVGFMTVNNTSKVTDSIPEKGFAVVELFTSEGCSSCPSADKTVARLVSKNIENVYVLAFHVDYWNRLGWKDPFSKAEYSQRQSKYASTFNLNSVYTPQVIVNGSSQFVGSDEDKLTTAVKNNLQKESAQHLIIDAKRSDKVIAVSYDITGNEAVLLNFALVQPEATTSVKRGENGGRTLHHVNIVRAFKTIEAKGKGSNAIDVPEELAGIPLQLISYTQGKKDLHISGAHKSSL